MQLAVTILGLMMMVLHMLPENTVLISSLGARTTPRQRMYAALVATNSGVIAMVTVTVTTTHRVLGTVTHSLSMALNMPIVMEMDMVTTQMETMPTIVP
jgi:hypothetical protein